MPGIADDIAASIQELSGAPAPEPSPSPAPEPSPSPAPEPSPSPSPAPSPAADGRQRGADGKFTGQAKESPDPLLANQKPNAPPAPDNTQAPVAGPVPPAPPPQALRPPVSWRPEARETWNQMKPEHQQEVLKREREVTEALQHSAESRRFHDEVNRAIGPYAHFIQAEGATPVRAIESLFQTAAALRTAPPQQKAMLVGDMILQFGVDLNTLDSYLSSKTRGGQFQPGPEAGIQQMLQQQLAPIQQFMQSFQQTEQQRRQAAEAEANASIEAFMNDPANEFAQDVAQDMADLIELAAKRGHKLSLQDAYARATLAHPTISKIVESRKTAGSVAQQNAAAQRARNAAASIPSGNAPTQSGSEEEDAGDIRSALSASIRQLSRPVR